MSKFVGDDTAYTNEAATYTVDDLIYASAGSVAVATGTSSTALIRVNTTQGWDNATAAKLLIFNAAGVLLGTATFTSALGTSWISASLAVSIVSGLTYYGGIICTGTGDLRLYNSGNTFECNHVNTGSYASPPTSINPISDPGSPKPMFNWYLDGTVSSGSGRLVNGCLASGLLVGSLAA